MKGSIFLFLVAICFMVIPSAFAQDTVRRSEGVIRSSAVNKAVPDYPVKAKEEKISGDVSVEIVIDEDGNVVETKIVKGPEILQAASVEAAKKWKFEPTTVDGKRVKVAGILTFRFVLN